jgi:CRISPR-associated protein Cas4
METNKSEKQIINITDITEYLYCPRKLFLKLVKGIRASPTERMMNGMLRHKVFELFNNSEQELVESINEKITESRIKVLYHNLLSELINYTLSSNRNIVQNFKIDKNKFVVSVNDSIVPEINLRVSSISQAIQAGFLAGDLWKNLSPKYLSEHKIVSHDLGLQGRIDRVSVAQSIIPFEIKSRDRIFDSDKIQLAGYALLLEKEFSQPINFGIIETTGKQHRVDLTPELKSQVLDIAEKIRNLTEENANMPSNFAKCENCDFKENCL